MSETEISTEAPLVDVRNLNVIFEKKHMFQKDRVVSAVKDVSLQIGKGETLGLVGETGSGKSTTGRAILKLVPVASGSVSVAGQDLMSLRGAKLRKARRNMQMIFQDPYSSLDPSATVGASISEPLMVHDKMSAKDARKRAVELLELVGLRESHVNRYPYEFSGGQRQRVAIARALALNPELIICDEAVSALDVSTQNQVINLLEKLRAEFGLSYLFIAHDLAIVRHISRSDRPNGSITNPLTPTRRRYCPRFPMPAHIARKRSGFCSRVSCRTPGTRPRAAPSERGARTPWISARNACLI